MGVIGLLRQVVRKLVSILLLMEIPKWAVPFRVSTTDFSGFNPSFDGNPEMGGKHPNTIHVAFKVSILLLMEIPKWASGKSK